MRLLLLLAGCALVLACAAGIVFRKTGQDAPAPAKRTLRVAAAADLNATLPILAAAFEEANPGIQISASYGSSGNFYVQLQTGAPFDLFMSANLDYPRRLIAEGKASKESEFIYAIGHLVVWARRASPVDVQRLGIHALLDPSVKKISMANPRFAPYGQAAEAALHSLGVYDQVKARLVLGNDVAQAAQFAQSGAADIGVFALSLALAPRMRDEGKYWQVPEDAYPRLEQGGVILNAAAEKGAADAFRQFLQDKPARAILRKNGFYLPGE